MVSLSSLQILGSAGFLPYQERRPAGGQKNATRRATLPGAFLSNNLTFAGRLFGLSLGRKVTSLP